MVGVVIGIVTLTGVGFKIAFMVTSVAANWAAGLHGLLAGLPFELFSIQTLTLLFTLLMTAVVCVLMGCGVPTTANYIIMVAVAAPVLGMMNVEPLVAHFFVFYFGVLADVTPPVALAAYAGAGIAGANGFKAGNTAFRLSMGKAMVPFVFVFSPSLLLVTQSFTLPDFLLAFTGAVLGIVALSAAITNWLLGPLLLVERMLLPIAALMMIAPEMISTAIGAAILGLVVLRQYFAKRTGPGQASAA
ncbi:MAG: TRAP transporter large permease subunit [Paracoccus aminovorans]|nr:TRAP transporter large permease subunit [Paracoccus aminovorans]